MNTVEYINPKIDRSKWSSGEWDGEPDKKQWQDTATLLPCLAVRHPSSGHWCGYVGLPKSHPYYGKDYDSCDDVEVHWGLTFSDKCQEVENECAGVCHKVPEGQDDVWWLGFDCAHSGDISPGHPSYSGGYDWNESYKTLDFVQKQCRELAKQLAKIPTRDRDNV